MRKFLFLIACFITLSAYPQKQKPTLIDSLIRELPHLKNDTATARMYKVIVEKYSSTDPAKAKLYVAKGLSLTSKMKWIKGISAFNTLSGNLYSDAGMYDSAMLSHQKAFILSEKINDKYNMASALNNMGVVCQRLSKSTEAIDFYFRSLKIGEEINSNDLVALGYDNISSVFSSENNYEKALTYSFKALKIRKDENNTEGMAGILCGIASIYLQLNDTSKAGNFYRQSLALYRQTDDKYGIATVYSFISVLYSKNYPNRLKYALMSEQLWDGLNPLHITAITNTGNIGVAYLEIARDKSFRPAACDKNIPPDKKTQLLKAETYLIKAIALSKATNDINNEAYFSGPLAELQELQGDYKNAYWNFRKYERVQDSVYSQANKNKIAAIESKREIDLKNIELQNKELELDNQRKQLYLLLSGIAFLILTGGLLYRQVRIRKRTNTILLQLNTELDAANKVKAKFFGILSHDLRGPVASLLTFLQLQKLQPGLLSHEQIAARENKITNSAQSLLETMETMLLWSKGQMEQFKPSIKEVVVNDLFEYLQRFFKDTESVTFTFTGAGNLIVKTDQDYLHTIMHNLTANAIKALQQIPNATIEWRAWQENDKLFLSVTDNGPGIKAEHLKALYDETTESGAKQGLGLHIIRDLARAINCSVTIQPKVSGTQFVLSI